MNLIRAKKNKIKEKECKCKLQKYALSPFQSKKQIEVQNVIIKYMSNIILTGMDPGLFMTMRSFVFAIISMGLSVTGGS